jgi:hypothetical protein
MRFVAALVFALSVALSAAACSSSGSGDDDSGDDTAAAADAGTPLPFMSECVLGMDDQCDTGLCFDFNTKGPHCTHECTVDTDCEDPSPGCNGMGVCKAPGGGTGGGTGGG